MGIDSKTQNRKHETSKGQAAIKRPAVSAGTLRGQAAIEYLMTYGWAILVLVIITAAIFSTGILSPTYLVSEECSLGSTFPCTFQLFNDGGTLKLVLNITNGFGYKINITKLDIMMQDEKKSFVFASGVPTAVESGDSISIEGTISGYTAPKNTIKKMRAEVTYYSCAPEINKDCGLVNEHIISGRVVGTVLEK